MGTVLFAANELAGFEAGSVTAWPTSTTRRRTAFTRAAMGLFRDETVTGRCSQAVTDLWMQAQIFINNTPADRQVMGWGDFATGIRYAVHLDWSSKEWRFKYWNGSAWTLVVAMPMLTSWATGLLNLMTLRVVHHDTAGSVELWLDGQEWAAATGIDTVQGTGIVALDAVQWVGTQNLSSVNSINCFSECLAADFPPFLLNVYTRQPSGAGAVNDWVSGSHSSISVATTPDAAALVSDAAAQDFLATHAAAIPTSHSVRAVVQAARAAYDGSGPTGLVPLQRHAGTTYAGAAVSPVLNTTIAGRQTVLAAPPSGGAWTPAVVNDSEFGWRSVA